MPSNISKVYFLKISLVLGLVVLIGMSFLPLAEAQPSALPNLNLTISGVGDEKDRFTVALQLLILLTILSLAPAILLMLTSFTRIIVVLSILRHALGTQQMPPNQVLIGLAMFLTFFIMTPVWQKVYHEAILPYYQEEVTGEVAWERASGPVKEFMLKHAREKDLALFIKIAKAERPAKPQDVPLWVVIPAFVISELKTAFQIGFMIYLPFLAIDMVVASVLLSMGMLMLPPIMISLPFKLLLFVLVDGWHLIVGSLVQSLR